MSHTSTTIEPLIPLTKFGAFCEREFGVRPHISTVHRWRIRGVRGVTLATQMRGGRRFVQPADAREFMRMVNEA